MSPGVLDFACTSVLASVVIGTLGFIWASVMQVVPAFALATGSAKVSTSTLASNTPADAEDALWGFSQCLGLYITQYIPVSFSFHLW